MSVTMWAYGKFVIGGLETLAEGLSGLPRNDLGRRGIHVHADIPYLDTGRREHLLDVYVPSGAPKPWPVAVYIHGGGFKYFDKNTHWAAAGKFAERGMLTFNINYRLAPADPYPAAVQDVSAALCWIAANAERLGGDLDRVLFSGESAGGNLSLGAAISTCWRRPEAHAQALFDSGLHPKVLLPACGYLGVSNPERHAESHDFPAWMNQRIHEVTRAYLPDHAEPKAAHAYANPLNLLDSLGAPRRPFPATFAIVGSKDPVLGDSIRLGEVLRRKRLNGDHRVYEGGIHGFHAAAWTKLAKRAWDDQMMFVRAHMPR